MIVGMISFLQNDLDRDKADSLIVRETGGERYIWAKCVVEYGNLLRKELRKCVERMPVPPSRGISREKNTALTDRNVNGDLGSLIYLYGKNQAECVIGESDECHEKCRSEELVEFHRCEIEVRGINAWSRRLEMEVDITDVGRGSETTKEPRWASSRRWDGLKQTNREAKSK